MYGWTWPLLVIQSRTIRHFEEIERESIVAALDAARGQVASADGAAERLGTKPSTARA